MFAGMQMQQLRVMVNFFMSSPMQISTSAPRSKGSSGFEPMRYMSSFSLCMWGGWPTASRAAGS